MTDSGATTELRFEPPGPGSWGRDAVHFPRPATRYWTEMHPGGAQARHERVRALLRDAHRRPPDGVRERHRVQPACEPAPEEEIPQRFQRAEEVFAGKLWREQLREWDETVKPSSIATHREIQAVDPDALSDEELSSVPHALPRSPRGDDHAAHALHGRGDAPDRRLPRARRRLDRALARRAARV